MHGGRVGEFRKIIGRRDVARKGAFDLVDQLTARVVIDLSLVALFDEDRHRKFIFKFIFEVHFETNIGLRWIAKLGVFWEFTTAVLEQCYRSVNFRARMN